jgi:hypothetical protein
VIHKLSLIAPARMVNLGSKPLSPRGLSKSKAVDQRLSLLAFVCLAARQDETQLVAEGIDSRVAFRAATDKSAGDVSVDLILRRFPPR